MHKCTREYSGLHWRVPVYCFVLFLGGRIPLFMLIGWHAAKVTFFARERSTDWLYELFVRTLILLTNACAGYGRPTNKL